MEQVFHRSSQIPVSVEHGVFRRDGEFWTVEFAGRVVHIRDTAGVRYLAALLRHPGEAIHVLEVRAAAGREPARRPRKSRDPGSAERARLAVTKGIAAAIERLANLHPPLGAHLRATIRRGYHCSYTPDPRHPMAWRQ
jgi:hypothetical protein